MMRNYIKHSDGDVGNYGEGRNLQLGESASTREEWLSQTQSVIDGIKFSDNLDGYLEGVPEDDRADLNIPENLPSRELLDQKRSTLAVQFNALPVELKVAFSTLYVAVNERLNQKDYEAALGIVNAAIVPAGFDTAQFKQIKARFVQAISDLQTLDG